MISGGTLAQTRCESQCVFPVWYNGGMEVGDWILVAAVIVSLGIGIASILHTKNIQEKQQRYVERTQQRQFKHAQEVRVEEYKTKVLQEIRDWALEVLNCNFGGKMSLTPGYSETVQKQAESVNRLLKCQELSVKGTEYIMPIAYSLRYDLDNRVEEVIASVNAVRKVIHKYGKKIDDPNRKKDLDEIERTLQHLVKGLINLTAEYETMNVVES